jgi:hypothetical protein
MHFRIYVNTTAFRAHLAANVQRLTHPVTDDLPDEPSHFQFWLQQLRPAGEPCSRLAANPKPIDAWPTLQDPDGG